MRNEIIKLLTEYKIDNICFLADGAEAHSIVNLNLESNKRFNREKDKYKYAIQFSEDTKNIAIWDVKVRIENNYSLNLYVSKKFHWNDIKHTKEYQVSVERRNSEIATSVVVLPFMSLEGVLLRTSPISSHTEELNDFRDDELNSFDIVDYGEEGRDIFYYGRKYERNQWCRDEAIREYGYQCCVCDMSFENRYGDIGKNYIEVHHLKPVCEGVRMTNPAKDLCCVCANCHRMLHRNKEKIMTPDELRKVYFEKIGKI